jgi:hypothetical protein
MRPLQKLIENTHSFPRGQIGTHKHMQGLLAHTDIQMQVHKYTLTKPEANADSHTSAQEQENEVRIQTKINLKGIG